MSKENVKVSKKAKKPTAKPFQVTDFDSRHSDSEHFMECNGLFAGLNMPPAIESKTDSIHSLPPYRKRMAFLVDEFPGCPSNWVSSQGKMKSYFVPVLEGEGMWLDFNKNKYNNHHVAIVVSVQGVNAITGMMTSDAHLEQYVDKCPKHNVNFGPDRLCSKCGFHWPKQNYISTTGTPDGLFWLDGFRAVDGAVRQYILTAEKMRGVASNIIGEERVFAIGLSFFLSKSQKPPQPEPVFRARSLGCYKGGGDYGMIKGSPSGFPSGGSGFYKFIGTESTWTGGMTNATSSLISHQDTSYNVCSAAAMDSTPVIMNCCSVENAGRIEETSSGPEANMDGIKSILRNGQVKTKNIEIGAGAKIKQKIFDDPESLDFWRNDPEAIICVNYAIEADVKAILERGRLDLSGSQEGFMQGMQVGN